MGVTGEPSDSLIGVSTRCRDTVVILTSARFSHYVALCLIPLCRQLAPARRGWPRQVDALWSGVAQLIAGGRRSANDVLRALSQQQQSQRQSMLRCWRPAMLQRCTLPMLQHARKNWIAGDILADVITLRNSLHSPHTVCIFCFCQYSWDCYIYTHRTVELDRAIPICYRFSNAMRAFVKLRRQ